MSSKEDLIYFGSILIWQSPAYCGDKDKAIEAAKEVYDKVFKENDI